MKFTVVIAAAFLGTASGYRLTDKPTATVKESPAKETAIAKVVATKAKTFAICSMKEAPADVVATKGFSADELVHDAAAIRGIEKIEGTEIWLNITQNFLSWYSSFFSRFIRILWR